MFEIVKDIVEEYVRDIGSVEVHDIYADVYSREPVIEYIEYIVRYEYGASVEIIPLWQPLGNTTEIL